MSNALMFVVVVLFCSLYLPAQTAPPGANPKPAVLQKSDGEWRTRRPREGVTSPSTDFLLKIGPKTNGSKHLLLFTEEIRPGATIPRHKHHGEDEEHRQRGHQPRRGLERAWFRGNAALRVSSKRASSHAALA